MRPVRIVLVALAVAAVAGAVFVSLKHEPDLRIDAPPRERVAVQLPAEADAIDVDRAAHPNTPELPVVLASEDKVDDYGAMIDKLLPLADAGNAKAQYDVYKATAYCQDRVKFYFTRAGRRLSMEEGLAWAIKRKLSYETAQAVHKKCGKFLQMDPKDTQSDTSAWLNASAKQGYGPAQAALATKILEEQLAQGFERASGVAGLTPTEALDRTKPAPELLKEAVKSRDPEVLFRIGDLMRLLNPTAADDDVGFERLAWIALACERGFDCSAQAEWVIAGCLSAECASINNRTELVRILAGDRWHEVQARARELGANLDAGRWDELGLDPG